MIPEGNQTRGPQKVRSAPQAEDSMDKGGETGKRMASLCDKQLDTNRTLSAKEDKENEDGCAVRDEIPKTEWPTVPVCTEIDRVPWMQGFQESPGKPGQDGHPAAKDVLCHTLARSKLCRQQGNTKGFNQVQGQVVYP